MAHANSSEAVVDGGKQASRGDPETAGYSTKSVTSAYPATAAQKLEAIRGTIREEPINTMCQQPNLDATLLPTVLDFGPHVQGY